MQTVAATYELNGKIESSRSLRKLRKLRIGCGRASHYCRADMEVARDSIQAVYVVRVGVRSEYVVNVVKPAPPQVFRNDRFAYAARVALERLNRFVFVRAASLLMILRPPASVNEQSRPVRHGH